jgi:hypothetical protein
MRIFEATGSGAFLLTEHFDNLARYFEIGTEIETFSDERELVDKIRHYLAHPEQRAEIAAAGQARCLRDHSMGSRLRDFDTIIRGVLEKKGRAGQAAPSCSVDPASATRGPLRGNGGSAGEPAGGTVLKALERSCGRLKKLIEDGDEKTRAAIAPEARKLVVELMARADGSAAETPQAALHLTSLAKSLRQPVPGLDVLRAKVFLGLGQERAAVQSLYEELRYFPDNEQARGLLGRLDSARVWRVDDAELDQALETIRPYTMVVEPHLLNLYLLAKKVCEADVPGDFVECGVAAGGTSALLAWVVKRFSKRPRRLFACDSFEGMPSPSEHDVHDSVPAEETGWGTGTCAAPQESLAEICRSLGVEDIVSPVKGYFKDTLPLLRERLGQVALLHMDGDWYDSTRDILVNLHDRLHEDALVQVDDYGHWDGCRKAVHDFAAERGVRMSLRRIEQGTGVWFAVKHARMVAEAVTR